MKTTALACVALAATVSSLSAAAPCSLEEHADAYTRLAVLMALDSFTQCAADSDYSLLYSTSLPTNDQVARMCQSASCNSMISTILTRDPPNCEIAVATSGLVVNVHEMSTGFADLCASMGISASVETSVVDPELAALQAMPVNVTLANATLADSTSSMGF